MTNKTSNRQRINISLPPETYNLVVAAAAAVNKPVSRYVAELVIKSVGGELRPAHNPLLTLGDNELSREVAKWSSVIVATIDNLIANFDGSELQKMVAKDWNISPEQVRFSDLDESTLAWMKESLLETSDLSIYRFLKYARKQNPSVSITQERIEQEIANHFTVDGIFVWNAELANRFADGNKETERQLLS